MKKLLATFLCAVMVLTMAPASVFASSVTEVDTLAELKAALADATVTEIKLTDNITVGDKIEIHSPVTIDGGNYTITGTAKDVFRIHTNVTFKNITIDNTAEAGRCINTRVDGITVNLEGVTLKANGNGNTQPLTIGGSDTDTTKDVIVNVKNSTIDALDSGYAAIVFVPSEINIENGSELIGYAALYFREGSDNSVVNLKNSTLDGQNSFSGSSNSFSTITFEKVKGVAVNVTEGSVVKASASGDQPQFAFGTQSGAADNTIAVDGTSTVNVDTAEELVGTDTVNTITFAVGAKSNVTIPAEYLPANAEQDANGVVVEKTTTTPGGNEGTIGEGTPVPAPEAEKKPENSPKTGDNSNMMPYVGFMVVAMMIMTGAVLTRRQTQK